MAKADSKNVALTDTTKWEKIVNVDAAKQDVTDLRSATKQYVTDYPTVHLGNNSSVDASDQTVIAGKRIALDGSLEDKDAYTLWAINMRDDYTYVLNANAGGDFDKIRFIQLEDSQGNVIAWEKGNSNQSVNLYITGFNGVCKVSHRNYYARAVTKYSTYTNDNSAETLKRKYNTVAYIANNGSATWSEHGKSTVKLTISDDIILKANNSNITIRLSDIISAVDGTNVTYSNGVFSGEHYCLYYDFSDNLPHFCSSSSVSTFSKYPILFYAHYGSVRSGLLVDFMEVKRTESIISEMSLKAENGIVYVANGGVVTWSEHSKGTVKLSISDDIVLMVNNTSYTITVQDIIDAADDAENVTYSEGEFSGSQFCLYYDLNDKKPKFCSTSSPEIFTHYPVLFYGHFAIARCGLLIEWMNTKRLEEIYPTMPYREYNAVAYIANNGEATWSKHGSGTVKLSISDNVILRVNGVSITVSLSDIINAADEASNVTYADDTFSGSQFCLYHDMSVSKPKFTSTSDLTTICKNPILFYGHYGSVRAGLLVDYMNAKHVEEVYAELIKIPSYYDTQLSSTSADVMSHSQSVGKNGISFVFCTDLHWDNNQKKSPALVKYIKDNTMVNMVILGGDYITQFGSNKQSAFNIMRDCMKSFTNVVDELYPIFGNHDRNSNNTTSDYYLTEDETYSVINSWMKQRAVYGNDYFDFYIDDQKTKTRFICIKTGAQTIDTPPGKISANTMTWIQERIDELGSDWHVIIVAHWLFSMTNFSDHVPVGGYTQDASALFNMLDIKNNDSTKATVEAIISGHMHCDYIDNTTGGIPIIFTDTDSMAAYGDYSATAGTVSEQCFDIITIDYKRDGNGKNKIYCDRIGRGVSRVYPTN